uniref:Ras-GEF domain-containing protein n=1 Tax=Ciona savignyi TaxID=51511 RepID=H2YU76_CIOSA
MNSENDDNLYPLKQTASFRIPPKPSRVPSFRKPVIRHSEVGRTSSPKSNPRNTSNLRFEGRNSPIAEKHAVSDIPSDLLNQQALTYTSNILQPNNKPLDASAMAASKKLLLHTDPFKIAKHITYHDYKVCQINTKGLERMFFPVGRNLRKQIIERYQCMAFWVAITVLSGGSDIDEMVDILNVYIQVANELVHSLGNVFGFSALMHGFVLTTAC